jgi:hypothetical protein
VLLAHGMMLRRTVQFHWRNAGYADFEDFLRRMTHQRRKNIRQERRRVREAGISFSWVEGEAHSARHWELFNRCYRRTYAEHRSSPYLNLDFFLRIGAALAENLALVIAEREGRPIACAFFVRDEERLYGRYWGALEHVPLLHFECCYYQAIEYAIARGPQGVRRRRAGRAQDLPRPAAGRGAVHPLAGACALRARGRGFPAARRRGHHALRRRAARAQSIPKTPGGKMRLKGKTAIVTGAGSGFGAGIAKRFAEEGAKVIVADINTQGGERVAKEVGGKFVQADVTKSADWARLVSSAGSVDVIVNNAGWTHRNKPYLEVTEAEFDRVYAVNVKSIYLSAIHAVPVFRKRGGGCFVNIASTAGIARGPASRSTTAPRAR